jgi:hypothetical protein
MDLKDLTPAERRVWKAFPRGEAVDFGSVGEGGRWGAERSVRAEVLRVLLLGRAPEATEVPALRVVGARITGALNLQYGVVAHPIRLQDCSFERTPILYGAQVRQLNLSGSQLPALNASTVRVDGVLRLTGCHIPGAVRLAGAKISGALFLDGVRLGGGLQLNHAVIGDDVHAVGAVVAGQVLFNGAQIAGALNLDDTALSNPGDTALNAENITTGAGLLAMRIRVEGRIELRGAKIPGQLNLAYARLSSPGGVALRASSCVIGELWLREAEPIEGSVNLRRSQFDLIHAAPEVWPGDVMFDGLVYGTLAPRLPAEQRLQALERDQDGYVPFAYEQLAAAYQRMGDDAGARTVRLAKQRRHRGTLPWYARVWGHAQDVTVGYGYRPMRAAAWLLLLLIIGTAAYWSHSPPPLDPGKAPPFNAFMYTLNLLLPIVDFGQAKAFNPHGAYQWLSYVLIAAGWILATTIVAGVTRTISRQ